MTGRCAAGMHGTVRAYRDWHCRCDAAIDAMRAAWRRDKQDRPPRPYRERAYVRRRHAGKTR